MRSMYAILVFSAALFVTSCEANFFNSGVIKCGSSFFTTCAEFFSDCKLAQIGTVIGVPTSISPSCTASSTALYTGAQCDFPSITACNQLPLLAKVSDVCSSASYEKVYCVDSAMSAVPSCIFALLGIVGMLLF